jgi:type IV secretory pathway VirB10-like protein
MNTFWLKVAGVGVLAVAVLIVAGQFTGGDEKPATREASQSSSSADVYEQDAKDHERLNAPIQAASEETQPDDAPAEPEQPESVPVPPFAQLTPDQQVAADNLWQMAETQFKIGRKPMMTFGQSVQYCRQIIEQFPGSEYAIKAKRILNDIVEINDRYKEQYHITDQELDMGPYR